MLNASYTIEEVSQFLRVSKLTVYDLIKKEELPAYRVGRQMRVDSNDLEQYKSRSKTGSVQEGDIESKKSEETVRSQQDIVISGQDIVLDMLGKHIESQTGNTLLRSYTGSLNSLISMYNGECDVVSTHLFDGETGQYNLPYVKRILASHSFIMINLVCRTAGIYVQSGNPHQIKTWQDLAKPGLTFVNREKGSGARVLLDEQLRMNNIPSYSLNGYNHELTSHFSIASAVSGGQADVGVGIENAAKMVDLEFIPLIKEQYDLVILKNNNKKELVEIIQQAVNSKQFRSQLEQLKGYDLSMTGKILFES